MRDGREANRWNWWVVVGGCHADDQKYGLI